MPKNFFKRILPHSDNFKKNQRLERTFGKGLQRPYLWVFNRHSVARGVFIGLFSSFIPLPGQMVFAAFFAIYFRANLPLSVSLVWISNPITLLPMMYAAYALGCYILGTPIMPLYLGADISWLWSNIDSYILPLVLGCLISALITAGCGYWIIRLSWRMSVERTWKERQTRRAISKKSSPESGFKHSS